MNNRILMLLFNEFLSDTRVKAETTALIDQNDITILCKSGIYGIGDKPTTEIVDINKKKIHIFRFPIKSEIQLHSMFAYIISYFYLMIITFIMGLFIIWKKRITVLHIHNPPDIYIPLILLCKLFRIKYIFDIHDLVPELHSSVFSKSYLYRLWIILEKINVALANVVIVTNESYKSTIMNRHSIDHSKIFIVRNGPTNEFIENASKPHRKNEEIRLGYVGNINPQDGVEFLVHAYSELKKEIQNIELLIIGDGKSLEDVKSIINKENIPNVIITGFISDEQSLHSYFSTIDLGISPDDSNPLNDKSTFIKILEYMAYEIPIIASDLPENRFSAGESAIYFTPGSIDDFLEKAKELINNKTKMREMGSLGKKRIVKSLSWNYSIPNLQMAYHHLNQRK